MILAQKNTAYFPKIMVVLSFTVSEVMILMLALDVANQAGNPSCGRLTNYTYVYNSSRPGPTSSPTLGSLTFSPTMSPTPFSTEEIPPDGGETLPPSSFEYTPPCGDLAIAVIWSVFWFIVAIFVGLLIPFNIFFYEANEVGRKFQSKLCEAIQYQGIALVLAGLTLGLMYWQINQFSLPIAVVVNDPVELSPQPCQVGESFCLTVNVAGSDIVIYNPDTINLTILGSETSTQDEKTFISSVPNSFSVYLACFLSFIGWFLFAMYTGVGFVTMPVDLIKAYLYRPRYIPKDVYIKLREDLRQRLATLLEMGDKMKKERKQYDEGYDRLGYRERYSKNNTQKTVFRQFKKEVEQLEMDYEDIRICHEAWSTYNPLIPYVKLVFGIISVILSVCWILQIVLYILPQYWPSGASYIPTFFLNDMVTWGLVYSGFSLLGVIFLAIFGLYLLACNVSGNFKIGLKFMIMDIHPMRVGGTYMSSFLVNVLLLLLQTPALINFLAQSFSNTIVLTDIDLIMNYMVRYTIFFVYFFENNVFIFLLLAFTILSLCLLYALPDDNKKAAKRLKKRIEKMSTDIDEKHKEANKKVRGINLKGVVDKIKEEAQEIDGAVAGT